MRHLGCPANKPYAMMKRLAECLVIAISFICMAPAWAQEAPSIAQVSPDKVQIHSTTLTPEDIKLILHDIDQVFTIDKDTYVIATSPKKDDLKYWSRKITLSTTSFRDDQQGYFHGTECAIWIYNATRQSLNVRYFPLVFHADSNDPHGSHSPDVPGSMDDPESSCEKFNAVKFIPADKDRIRILVSANANSIGRANRSPSPQETPQHPIYELIYPLILNFRSTSSTDIDAEAYKFLNDHQSPYRKNIGTGVFPGVLASYRYLKSQGIYSSPTPQK